MVSTVDQKVKCRKCRKSPNRCTCFEYRLEKVGDTWAVFVDNVARMPVRGETVGTWQTRKNSMIYRRPQYIDSFGPICYTRDREIAKELMWAVREGVFHVKDFAGREGVHVKEYDPAISRTFSFLRR